MNRSYFCQTSFKIIIVYFSHIWRWLHHIGLIYKIELLLQVNNNVLFAPTSYTKMFCSEERLIQFLSSLYPMLLFTLTPFKNKVIPEMIRKVIQEMIRKVIQEIIRKVIQEIIRKVIQEIIGKVFQEKIRKVNTI